MSQSDSEDSEAVMIGSDDIRDFNEGNILSLPADELEKIQGWLTPTPYDQVKSEFSRHLASYLQGTGQWLISTGTYQQWHEGDGNEDGLLWLKGIPGSGKSVMAASIIHRLHQERVPVLYFFFRQIIDANHQPVAALRDWLCQALPFSPPLQVRLRDEYLKKKRDIHSLALSDLWKELKFALSAFPKVYCVIDALDEMDQGNNDFLHSLAELGQWRPANVKVIITSRPVVAVESPLRPFHIHIIQLEERLVDKDIAAYVQYRLRNSSVPQEYWNLVTEAVPGRANGLFLYAQLSMDAFTKTGADPKLVLEMLPTDLNVMYSNLLREHAKRSDITYDFQLLILQFVTHAIRPLRLLEVAEMAKVTYIPVKGYSLKEIKDLVRAACGPLLQILHDETISVIHHSLTEFLRGLTRTATINDSSYPILETGPTNKRLAIACMDYLTSGCIDGLKIETRSKSERLWQPQTPQQSAIRLQFPFLEYAASNWHIHMRRAALAGEDISSFFIPLDDFLSHQKRFLVWLDIDWPKDVTQGLTPLHVAACTGLSQYARYLLQEREADPNARCENCDTPLYWAAYSGYADVAQVLIDNGADPDREAHEGYKPLHAAASHNHADMVKVLLASGVNPLTPKMKETPGRFCGNASSSIGHTPLMYACQKGHTETVAEFLPYIRGSKDVFKALLWSAGNGHAVCVDLILQQPGIDVNSLQQVTPLYRACKNGDRDTITVLLKAGADPNVYCHDDSNHFRGRRFVQRHSIKPDLDPRGDTALHALCAKRYDHQTEDSVRLLLEAGANVHLKCSDGKTALHYACSANLAAVKLLLDAGADPTALTDNGSTILDTDGSTDKELLPILLNSGLEMNDLMTKGIKSPLFSRLQGYHYQSVLDFLKYIPDVNITDSDGNCALHLIIQKGVNSIKEDLTSALLAAGANPNLQNRKGETALHLIRDCPKPELVSRLIKAGADLEARDLEGQTALFKSMKYDNSIRKNDRISDILIGLGAQIDTRDYKGRTLLHQAVGLNSVLNNLIARVEFDPSVIDNKGNTLFHEAVSKKHYHKLPSFIHLKELGVDIDQPNHRGKTPLMKMCARNESSTEFDYFIQECKNLNPRDCDGIQPIHVCAAVSESNFFKLLSAGADILAATNEKMTVLHIAARARKPGIIGLVLLGLTDLDDDAYKAFINQRNAEGKTALFYACKAGYPESVDLLLDAGADQDSSEFRACAEFEVEHNRWINIVAADAKKTRTTKARRAGSIFLDQNLPSAADVLKESLWRQARFHGLHLRMIDFNESYSIRLDKILCSLFLHGAQSTGDNSSLRDAFYTTVLNQRDYTTECLLKFQSRFLPNTNLLEGEDALGFIDFKSRMENETSFLRKKYSKTNDQEKKSVRRFEAHCLAELLGLHQYEMLEEMMTQMNVLELYRFDNSHIGSILHLLAQFGLLDILKRFCSIENALKFDDHDWCNQAETAYGIQKGEVKPLLMVACNREIPNMAVVRFLVEEMRVDINVNAKYRMYVPSSSVIFQFAEGMRWWHVHQALPYLIEKGANLESCNEKGETPLHIALEHSSKGVFCKDAVQILLDGGADPNAVDGHGSSCLSKAGTDVGLIKLLLSHGARVTPAALFSAIELRQVELLELFLTDGEMANLRRPVPQIPEKITHERDRIPVSEIYPLYHAAFYQPRSIEEDDFTCRIRLMKVLLGHNANPYSTFLKLHRVENDPEQWQSETCTIIHEIMRKGILTEPLLDLPSLQLEIPDAKGQTLLLAASQGSIKAFEILLARGADVTAQDHEGKTALHNLLKHEPNEANLKYLKEFLNHNPHLVCISDKFGDTPIHYVLKAKKIHLNYIDLLLEQGADPLQPDSNGNTALHFFAKAPSDYKSRIEQFQGLGVDINARSKEGNSPLFNYIAHGQLGGEIWRQRRNEVDVLDNLRYFKEAGADFFACNHAGSSLLHTLSGRKSAEQLARIYSNSVTDEDLVSWFNFLTDLGLDPMLEDAQQRTCLDVAAAAGNENILKLFRQTPAK